MSHFQRITPITYRNTGELFLEQADGLLKCSLGATWCQQPPCWKSFSTVKKSISRFYASERQCVPTGSAAQTIMACVCYWLPVCCEIIMGCAAENHPLSIIWPKCILFSIKKMFWVIYLCQPRTVTGRTMNCPSTIWVFFLTMYVPWLNKTCQTLLYAIHNAVFGWSGWKVMFFDRDVLILTT